MEELLERKKELEAQIEELQGKMKGFELNPDDYEDSYREAIDLAGDLELCGMTYNRSYALMRLDPTAYRCGLLDFVDSMEKEEDPQYKEMEEGMEELESELSDIEEEIENFEKGE
jgi:predicted  nucleic acid-binding Zn-ribbon protein